MDINWQFTEEEIQNFIFMHNEIKRRFDSDAFVWPEYNEIYEKITKPLNQESSNAMKR